VEYVRSQDYESPTEDLLISEQVGGPDAHGYSSRMVGVRAHLTDGSAWIPVRQDDLEAADERGSLTAAEIAEILASDELPVEYEPTRWAVGEPDELE